MSVEIEPHAAVDVRRREAVIGNRNEFIEQRGLWPAPYRIEMRGRANGRRAVSVTNWMFLNGTGMIWQTTLWSEAKRLQLGSVQLYAKDCCERGCDRPHVDHTQIIGLGNALTH